MMEQQERIVRQILAETANCPIDSNSHADLYEDLGVASVHAMMLLMALEERFEIQVPDDQFIEARTISQLTAMVDSLLPERVNA